MVYVGRWVSYVGGFDNCVTITCTDVGCCIVVVVDVVVGDSGCCVASVVGVFEVGAYVVIVDVVVTVDIGSCVDHGMPDISSIDIVNYCGWSVVDMYGVDVVCCC